MMASYSVGEALNPLLEDEIDSGGESDIEENLSFSLRTMDSSKDIALRMTALRRTVLKVDKPGAAFQTIQDI